MSKRRGTYQRCHAEYQLQKDGMAEQRTLSHPLQQTTLLRLSYNRHLTRRIHINETLPNTSYSHRDAIVHPFNRIDDPIIDHIPDPILQNLPPTSPNIFYKPADTRALLNWSTALAIKLTDFPTLIISVT